MKLSKEELEFALTCAKSYYYQSSESDYPNKSDKDNEARYRDLENALYADKLDIEGYERSEWTKFDPNDPKTFPPKGARYLIVTGSGQFIVSLFIDDKVIKSFWEDCVTHWKALPPPPNE